MEPIDFAGLADALLGRAHVLVPQWLPGGRRRGKEYVCGGLEGGEGESCSVNLDSGAWADFATGDKGGDLTSLFAAVRGLNNGQAARELMADLGWQQPARPMGQARRPGPAAAAPAETEPQAEQQQDEATPGRRRSVWRAVVPVPEFAPAPDFRHWHYEQPEATWEYVFEGRRYGYVVRFRTSEGGKEILPYTWCVDEGDARGTQRWHWKQWDEPRPLYVPATVLSDGGALPVVLVEGEKCALAGHRLLGHEFDFVSWPGGGKAWPKAAWGWLMGRTVYLWPDCDAKRQPLTRAEREAGVDPATKPLLPESRQPGMAAMVGLGAHLQAEAGCTVFLCPVPAAGAVADGWDLADAVAQGWGPEEVRAFIRGARAFVAPADGQAPEHAAGAGRAGGGGGGRSTPSRAAAGDGDGSGGDRRTWRDELLRNKEGAPRAVRENIALALDGVPEEGLAGIAEVAGCIAYNEFTNDIVKLYVPPWQTPAGAWLEVDELRMGEWLVRKHALPSVPRQTLEEAVRMVASRHAFHPVRAYLQGLRWDGVRRLRTWLRRACLEEDEWDDADPLHRYLAAAGTYYLMGMCQRVLQPGCKFDYMLVLESPEQGKGKSSLFRVLGGEYFADTGLVLGDKDSYQQLQGRWLYEMGELDALSKIEITKVKQYIASQADFFRASFDRRAREYPRQVVFGGTTNDDQYLIDSTGNRRFWPVRVTRQVDLQWMRENRDQLFAEACARLKAGKRYHPLPDEERLLFAPQQEQRRVVGPVEAAIVAYLYDETQRTGVDGENGTLKSEVTLGELLKRIGYTVDKQTDVVHKRAAAVMRRLGWEHKRSSAPGRPWVYRRPPASKDPLARASEGSQTPQHDAAAQPEGADSDCPF